VRLNVNGREVAVVLGPERDAARPDEMWDAVRKVAADEG
jgi:hypothetical protein